MPKIVMRGYVPGDEKEFNMENIRLLRQVQKDIEYLINRGYDLEGSVTFLCNRFGLSKRQRMALIRSMAKHEEIVMRKEKEVTGLLTGKTVRIDGFNQIITLEVALSGSILLLCMDGSVRDLAGLHGTYKIIDKTDMAIHLICRRLLMLDAAKAIFYLDSPVSNSGRLKQRILELSGEYPLKAEVFVLHDVDKMLCDKENIVTSDSIILDECISWVNLNRQILAESFFDYSFVDLSVD